jgi:hypothetical protein
MKKPSSKIREEITKLQEQLRQAETREAERIGRIALRAGLGEIEIEETAMLAAFEELAGKFREGSGGGSGKRRDGRKPAAAANASGTAQGEAGES